MIKSASRLSNNILEVKSKYDAEFRRFGLNKQLLTKFEEFYAFLERLHNLVDVQFVICYTDKDGELLPINNDCNFHRVLNVTAGILRLIIQRKGECYNNDVLSTPKKFNLIETLTKPLKDHGTYSHHSHANAFKISYPEDFRPVSAIIDVDILPDTYRRVRLHKHKSSKPLGFYIRDGRSIRVTANGVEQVPSIFISRLMPGGLAESTGLLSVNDEVIEVNGIEVSGKTLDQVTDMMVANSSNLIITVKPANQRYNLNRSSHSTSHSTRSMNANKSSMGAGTGRASGASSLSSNSMRSNSIKKQTAPIVGLNNNTNSGVKSGEILMSTPQAPGVAEEPENADMEHDHVDDEDDDDDDEEIHDANNSNSNEDKILTL